MKKIVPILALLMVVLISCNITLAKPPSFDIEDGTLVLVLNSNFKSATITPPDLSIGSFEINGISGIETFGPEIVDTPVSSYTIPGLAEGVWDITVDAYDASGGSGGSGTLIATDTAQANISDSSVETVDITVIPITGTGTSGQYEIDLIWSASAFELPVFTLATLDATDVSTSIANIDSVAGTADLDGTILAGYYTLTITLDDNTADATEPITIIAAVRIIDGYITTGTLNFNDPGSLTLNLGSQLQDPFDIVFSGHSPSLSKGASDTMTVTALIDEIPDPDSVGDTYAWYLNGALQSSTIEDIVIDSSVLPVGFYTLTAVVGQGSVLSSDDITFTVEE